MAGLISALDRMVGWLGPDRPLPERAALFAAAAVVGPSFEPGLQPRRTVDQAVATGVISSATLASVTLSMSAVESLGRIVTRDRANSGSQAARLAITIGTNAVGAAIGFGVARLLPAREDETFRRGLARTIADRSGRTALLTTGLAASIGIGDFVASRGSRARWANRIPLALTAGTGYAAYSIHRSRKRAEADNDETMAKVSTGTSIGMALGVGIGVTGLQAGERLIAHGVRRGVVRVAPSYEPVATPLGHLASFAILGGLLATGYEYAIRRVEDGGAAIEPAYDVASMSSCVSGGPDSLVSFDSLSREGRRFVNMALSRKEIEDVMGEPAVADPIRAFVGLASAPDVEERVDLLMDELVRLDAFSRDVLCFASPTGSGYINYVMAETLEYLSRGNSAIFTMQYSLLPSFLSLDRTRLAVEQNRALMHAVTGYLRGMAPEKRPRFVLFGESLGAQTMQDVYSHRNVEALDRDYVTASVFVGTPAATKFAKAWRLNPEKVDPTGSIIEVDNFGEYAVLPKERKAAVRHFLVSHFDDPIPKFAPTLLIRQPWWLGPEEGRPPRVPKSTRWRPATTFVLTGVDLINAMEVVPGRFGRRGHDYREDLPRFTMEAYGFEASATQLRSIEEALRARELRWAEKRVVTEQIARARETVLREMKSWGISSDSSPLDASTILKLLSSEPS